MQSLKSLFTFYFPTFNFLLPAVATPLAQCDAFGFIYDKAGDPAPNILVTLKKVYDADGNPILLSPATTVTNSDGAYHFTLPQNALVYISARATTLFICPPEGVPYRVPLTTAGELVPAFPPPEGFMVLPPLSFVSNTLSIPQSSATVDGYLSAVDYVRFDAVSTNPGVTSFNLRSGDVVPVGSDYQAFYLKLTGGTLSGPLNLPGDPTLPLHAATMQYVLNQIAGATAGVSSFNGRNGAVVPLAPDYASFYAPITHTHSKSQITDLAVFSTSQAGLVPQPTSGDAAKVLSGAGTWVTQASGGGGGTALPGQYVISDFNASGSATKYSGSISSGSTTLTTTTTTNFQVNQGIYIAGAGTSGAALITKVTAISGTTITLQNAAGTTVTAVANNVQHDDTVAIQTAIDTVVAAGGGEIQFPVPGYYRVNGPFTSINSILKVPYKAAATDPPVSLSLVAHTIPISTMPGAPAGGVVIQTDKVGTSTDSSILAFTTWDGGTNITNPSNIIFKCQGIIFRTYDNPNISGLDCGMCTNCTLEDVLIDTTGGDVSLVAQPTHGTFGLRLPRINASQGSILTKNVGIQAYSIGVIASELWNSRYTAIGTCAIGVKFIGGNFYCCGDILLYHTPTSIQIDAATILDLTINLEQSTSGWYAATAMRDIYDPGDHCSGRVAYLSTLTATGTNRQLQTTGLTDCSITSLRAFGAKTSKAAVEFADDLQVDGDLLISLGGVTQLVSVGANDSAGSTFRQLRVPNAGAVGLLTGLQSYWKLDEGADPYNDSITATGNNASHGGVGPASNASGKIGGCVQIKGDTFLYVADNSYFDFTGKSLSITGWIKITSFTTWQWPALVGKWDESTTGREFLIFYDSPSGQWQWRVSSNGTALTTCAVTDTPAFNTWIFLAATFDVTNGAMTLRVGSGSTLGTPGTATHSGGIYNGPPATSLLFGAWQTSSGIAYGNSFIDEIGMWTRVLTATEIGQIFNGGAGLSYPF